jgi:GDP-L-fucose synthase
VYDKRARCCRTTQELTGFQGPLVWDPTKPDGHPRRCLDTTRAAHAFGFRARTTVREGGQRTIDWSRQQRAQGI